MFGLLVRAFEYVNGFAFLACFAFIANSWRGFWRTWNHKRDAINEIKADAQHFFGRARVFFIVLFSVGLVFLFLGSAVGQHVLGVYIPIEQTRELTVASVFWFCFQIVFQALAIYFLSGKVSDSTSDDE